MVTLTFIYTLNITSTSILVYKLRFQPYWMRRGGNPPPPLTYVVPLKMLKEKVANLFGLFLNVRMEFETTFSSQITIGQAGSRQKRQIKSQDPCI